uniref:Pentacotripeptide-repeat region of PRORP domain-containing protein n=1 Tax=Pseudo-nitzschia arenysensis TaxID=697910 RepID=A0A7R9ZTR2_9STRA|mmetsp:Transcript_334/g.764  ORF Transcript_334/g.764 Transcript_334/m.764 type:complete len:705 (+) Transcript_334:394-2508(+)
MRRIISRRMINISFHMWVYGLGLLLFADNSPIEALKGSTRLITPAVGRQPPCRDVFMPISLLSYASHRIRHGASTRIHSMTIDPRTGLSVSAEGLDDGDAGDDIVGHGDHQLDLHQVNNDDASHSDGSSKPFTTSSYLAAVSPEAQYRKKRRANNRAMNDISFLRKRTSNLLKKTAPENYFMGQEEPPHQQAHLSPGMKINLNTFNFLIDGWAFSGEADACDKAMTLLERMEEMYYNYGDNSPVCPDVRSYTKVINCLSRSKKKDAASLAEGLLYKMDQLADSGENPSAKPNTFTYTAALEAQANSGLEGSPEKAEELLVKMIHKYQSGDPDVLPNARCFNAAISAYAKSAQPGAAQQAEILFDRLDGLYMSGLEEAKPNSFNYNSLINAWANCPDQEDENGVCSARRAQEILERMEQCYAAGDESCKPTTVSYNAVIDAYAKSRQEEAAERAEQVLRRMGVLYKEGADIKPNTRSFNTVINAWAKSGREDAAEKAQDLLDLMSRLYEEGNNAVRPDVHSVTTVINAFARSNNLQDKAERANNLFRAMKQTYEATDGSMIHLRPNLVTVNAVMNACAYTTGDIHEQNRAMEIAHERLKHLEDSDYGSPDQITYGTFLKVCANQMPDCATRQQIMEVIFQKSTRDGMLGNLVLQQLRAMGPPELFYRLTGFHVEDESQLEDLPKDWWCNVVEGRWRRRRHDSDML